MCEELNLNTNEEDVAQSAQDVPAEEISVEKIPAEQWWNEEGEPTEYVDVTPELPPQPVYEQPVQQPQPMYQPPVEPMYQQPVQPMPPQYTYQQSAAQQQPIYQQPYSPYPVQPAPQKNDLSLISLVVGIVALFIGYYPLIGWVADIAAIITGIISKSKGDKTARTTLGIVFGVIGAVCAVFVMIFIVMFMFKDASYLTY